MLAIFGIGQAFCQFTTVDFSASFNRRLQDNNWGSIGLDGSLLNPTGVTILAGVPFAIPSGGVNYWHSYDAPTGSSYLNPMEDNLPRTLIVPTAVPHALRVYALINSYWGEPGPHPFARIEFLGNEGATASFELVGEERIRDFNSSTWVNQNPASVNVLQWTGWLGNPTQRLDRQRFDLPPAFQGQTLVRITLIDSGGFDRLDVPTGVNVQQRTFLAGLTVETCSEPTIAMRWTEDKMLEIDFNGVLQHSEDLMEWEDLDPQPVSPWTISPTAARRFFRSRCHSE